jgi:hypothetical protein
MVFIYGGLGNSDDIRQFDYASFPMEELGRIK